MQLNLRNYIEALREDKTEQNVSSLARRWRVNEVEALRIARKLRDVGFFEERTSSLGDTTFWVPFVYRPYLQMSQGKVEQISSPELPLDSSKKQVQAARSLISRQLPLTPMGNPCDRD